LRVTTAAATRKPTAQPTSTSPSSGYPRPGLRRHQPAAQRRRHPPPRSPGKTEPGGPLPASTAAPTRDRLPVPVGGTARAIGGTSAVAPLWAGLVCCLTQALDATSGYSSHRSRRSCRRRRRTGVPRDHHRQQRRAYTAGPGWHASTGLGGPNGRNSSTMCAPADDRAALERSVRDPATYRLREKGTPGVRPQLRQPDGPSGPTGRPPQCV